VGNSTDFDDEPDGENPGGVQKGFEAVVLHPEQAGSRYGVVLDLWQRMAFVAVLCSCADVSNDLFIYSLQSNFFYSEATGQEAHNGRMMKNLWHGMAGCYMKTI